MSLTPIKDLIDDGFTLLSDFKRQGEIVKKGDVISNAFEKKAVKSESDIEYYNDISHMYGHDTTLFIKKSN